MSSAGFYVRDARPDDSQALVALWHRCELTRPWNDPQRDIERAHAQPATRILVGTLDDRVMASGMVGHDGHRGWLYYLAVDPAERGHGYGAEIIAIAERYLIDIGCPKLMMMVRPGQPRLNAYYERLGFRDNAIVAFGKRLIADNPSYDR